MAEEELRRLAEAKKTEEVTYKSYLSNTYKADMNQQKELQKEKRMNEIAEERERLRLIQ
jgi:hypothetical protein